MIPKRGIIVIAAILVVALLVFTGMIPLFEIIGGEDYNTGISRDSINNCETEPKLGGVHDFGFGAVGGWVGNPPLQGEPDELIVTPLSNNPVVTAMKSGGISVSVTIQGTLGYGGVSTIYWVPDWGWYEVAYSTNGRDWDQNIIINTKDDQIDQSIVTLFTGPRTKQKYARLDPGFEIRHPFYPTPVQEYKYIKTIAFQITGMFTGALRVRHMTEFSAFFGAFHDTMEMSVDYAYLASGGGDVEIVDDMTVYEEGETIRFEVDTGFSGQTQGGVYTSKGWQLKIYDSSGSNRKTWTVDDDKRGGRQDSSGSSLDYRIPGGSYQSDGSNTWKVVLTNTLFDQDEELFFAIGIGMREQAPSVPTIEFSVDEYRLGDSVYVTFTSTPNPLGRNKVDGFLVNAIYGKDGVDYIPGYQAKYVSAGTNTATVSFSARKGDNYITVEAWAFDAPENQGGIPSEKNTESIWIKDKESAPIEMDYTGMIVALIILIVFGIVAVLVPVGFPIKILIFLIGVVVAVLVYVYWFTGLFGA